MNELQKQRYERATSFPRTAKTSRSFRDFFSDTFMETLSALRFLSVCDFTSLIDAVFFYVLDASQRSEGNRSVT